MKVKKAVSGGGPLRTRVLINDLYIPASENEVKALSSERARR